MIKAFLDTLSGTLQRAETAATLSLPLFPLGSVLFPDGTLSLKIFEQRYMDMASSCLKNSAPFGIVLIREGSETGTPATPEATGTLARIVEWDMQQIGILQVRVQGGERFRIASHSPTTSGLIIGEVTLIENDLHVDCPEFAPCAGFLRKILSQIGSAHLAGEPRFHDAAWVGFRITELLPFSNAVKQKMLELTDARMRIEILHRFLLDRQLIVV